MKNLRNLTQSSRRNDPINRRMQGYSFQNFRRRRWSSRCKFFLLSQSNIDLKCSIDAETSLEHPRTNGTRNNGVYKEYFRIEREPFFSSRRTHLKKTILKHSRWMKIHHDERSRSCAPLIESASCDDRPILIVRSQLNRRSFR